MDRSELSALMEQFSASPIQRMELEEKDFRLVLDKWGDKKHFIPSITYGGPGTIYPHVEEIVIDEINRYNKERFGVAI